MTQGSEFKIQAYNKTQLLAYYHIGAKTLNRWLAKVPDLGAYQGKIMFTPAQVKKIVDHIGPP